MMRHVNASGCISADPLLNATWHIAGGSPCRNKGVVASAPDHDFEAQARPNEAVFDIGADEFY